MIHYTACAGCGGLLQVTADALKHHTGHPAPCTPTQNLTERLTDQWLDAVLAGNTDLEADLHTQIEELDTRPPRLLDAALVYAGWGWPVFPLRAGTKTPATRHGFKDATTDLDRVRAWWTRHPDHNIGLPTGLAFDVIDIDVPDGVAPMQTILAGRGETHGHVATSSGGAHYYVKPTGRGNTARSLPGVDYRGVGGYVVAPPSTLGQRGRSWSWINRPSPQLTGQGDTYGR